MNLDLVKEIKERYPKMSKSHKVIAAFILEKPDVAAYLTATKLGCETGVSESTVVRFAIELGYKGYPEMQRALVNLIRTNMTSVQRVAAADSIMAGSDVLTKVMNQDSEKINEIGLRLAAKYSRTKWFVSDFKKADGQKKSEAICDAYDIYRQDYCGCKTSYYERHPEKISE